MVQQGKKVRFKIEPRNWYFIDLSEPLLPKVIADSYKYVSERDNCFNNYLLYRKRYFYIKGKHLLKYKGEFKLIKPPYTKVKKHDYRNMISFKVDSKKQKRAIFRRRLRLKKAKDLGLYKLGVIYEYPEWCITQRQRKTFREMERRKYWSNLKVIY